MSYHKMTLVAGRTSFGDHKNTVRAGHWKPAAMVRLARTMGLVGVAEAEHSTGDMSGKGRGGYDRNFVIDVATGTVTDAPLNRYQRETNETCTFDED